jgi:hypothetical protein
MAHWGRGRRDQKALGDASLPLPGFPHSYARADGDRDRGGAGGGPPHTQLAPCPDTSPDGLVLRVCVNCYQGLTCPRDGEPARSAVRIKEQ